MKTSIQKERMDRIAVSLFYFAFAIELGMVLIDKSALTNPFEGQLFRITFLLFVIKIALTQYSNKEYLVIAGFAILGAISYIATGRNEIIRIVVFVAAAKNIPIRRLMKITFYTLAAGVGLLVLLSLAGVLGEVSITGVFRGELVETRYTLGIGHPNALHCMAWSLVILGIYLYFEQLKWYVYLLLLLANFGLFYLTDSRTGFLIITMTILSAAFLHFIPKARTSKYSYLLGAAVVCGCFGFTLIASKYGYTEGPLMGIDQYLGRIRWSYFYGGLPHWSLFSVPENVTYFDMGFMRLFYWYGMIPGVIYGIVHVLFIRNTYKQKDCMALLMIVMFAVYTVFEAHAVSVYIARNFVLLLLAGSWSQVFLAEGKPEKYFWRILKKEG